MVAAAGTQGAAERPKEALGEGGGTTRREAAAKWMSLPRMAGSSPA